MGIDITKTRIFTGKVVLVYLVNAAPEFANGISIYKPEIREILGRTFIVGTVPNDIQDWTSGLRVGIDFDQVFHFVEFRDEAEYLERIQFDEQMVH
ncbi:MAG TPA: hypothetical protein PKM41_02560 [Deltaproteobacteria bacterium]|jgi:hypothetical protein|nr:hypothetical protein [Deltaproteobacteria bacterium]HOI05876.1 hypothetical protein [Deltaproteobacteria bacterium]